MNETIEAIGVASDWGVKALLFAAIVFGSKGLYWWKPQVDALIAEKDKQIARVEALAEQRRVERNDALQMLHDCLGMAEKVARVRTEKVV